MHTMTKFATVFFPLLSFPTGRASSYQQEYLVIPKYTTSHFLLANPPPIIPLFLKITSYFIIFFLQICHDTLSVCNLKIL